jgi:hypothetical protein
MTNAEKSDHGQDKGKISDFHLVKLLTNKVEDWQEKRVYLFRSQACHCFIGWSVSTMVDSGPDLPVN